MFLYTNIQYQFHSIYCFIEKQMKFILAALVSGAEADWVNISQMLHFMEKHEAPSSAAVFVLSIRHFFCQIWYQSEVSLAQHMPESIHFYFDLEYFVFSFFTFQNKTYFTSYTIILAKFANI